MKLKANDTLNERMLSVKESAARCRRVLRTHRNMFATLEALDVDVLPDLTMGTMDCRFIGDSKMLRSVWRVLRLHGFEPDQRPGNEPEAYFSTFWRKTTDGRTAVIFMSFSSTICTRKQVGTRMEEVPVYETVCDSSASPPVTVESD